MQNFLTINECLRAIIAFLMSSATRLPDRTKEALQNAQMALSPVAVIMSTIEALYAAREDLDDNGKMLVASLVQFATPLGWYNIQEDNRGGKIQMAMFRDSGMEAPEGSPWPDASKDPEVAYDFRPLPTVTATIDYDEAPTAEPTLPTPMTAEETLAASSAT